MNNISKLLTSLIVGTPLLVGCASGEDGFSGTAGNSSSNIISANNFSVGVSETNPEVVELATGIRHGGVEVQVIARAGDRNQAIVTSGTVYFRTEYGLLTASSCQLDSTGTCSVTWISSISGVPADNINTITAWTLGEESFVDLNGNGNFDDGDLFVADIPEPYLDLTHDGRTTTFDPGDVPIDLDGNNSHTPGDTLYNGAGCTHSSLCGATTRIYIFDTVEMNLLF